VRIISEKPIKDFWEKHPEAESTMKDWIKRVREAVWDSFSDVRKTFNHADVYKYCVIFNVGGNKYRVISKIKYEWKIVYIRFVLTHFEYDQKKWQADCQD
jgi:mRNA interferase HigB